MIQPVHLPLFYLSMLSFNSIKDLSAELSRATSLYMGYGFYFNEHRA